MNFIAQLHAAWKHNNSLVCVGLDPEAGRFPISLRENPERVFEFCRAIVDSTADLVCAYKPQIAYFSAQRAEATLEKLIAYIHERYPRVPVILDAKRGDMGTTAQQYAIEAFDRYGADALTLNPYLGYDAVRPFLERRDKGAILLCHTSNPGAGDLQELDIADATGGKRKLYQHVAQLVAEKWNSNGNCALVVGATYPDELADVRSIVGSMPLLVPGVGAQGGDAGASVRQGCTADGTGLIISSSRAILYASAGDDFATAARSATLALRDEINRYR